MTASHLEAILKKDLQEQSPATINDALANVQRAKSKEIDSLPENVRLQVAGVFKECASTMKVSLAGVDHTGEISHSEQNALNMIHDLNAAANKLTPPSTGASR